LAYEVILEDLKSQLKEDDVSSSGPNTTPFKQASFGVGKQRHSLPEVEDSEALMKINPIVHELETQGFFLCLFCILRRGVI